MGLLPFGRGPRLSVLFFASFLSAAFARQGLLDTLFLAGLQVKGVALYLLNNVFLLHLALEPAQGVLQRFAFLNSDFRQTNDTPKLVPLDWIVIATFRRQVKCETSDLVVNGSLQVRETA